MRPPGGEGREQMDPRVVVVGGGITGLAAAYRLQERGVPFTVLEREASLGGKVRAAEVGGLPLEAGPDSLLARKPWAVDLVRALGMGEDLAAASPAPTHIWTRAGLLRFPSGPLGISTDPWELARWDGMTLGRGCAPPVICSCRAAAPPATCRWARSFGEGSGTAPPTPWWPRCWEVCSRATSTG